MAASMLLGSGALAAPAPPPGGHIPVFFGGYNGGAYPALSPLDVGPEGVESWLGLAVRSEPNPFRTVVLLRFAARPGETARLRVFDVAGRQMHEAAVTAAAEGRQELRWDGRDGEGRNAPEGVYLYRLDVGARSTGGRLVLIR